MNKKDVRNLELGLYILFWKSGGSSLASVGQDKSGALWFAPSNWVSTPCTNWKPVLRVEKIRLTSRAADAPKSAPVCTCSMDDGIHEWNCALESARR